MSFDDLLKFIFSLQILVIAKILVCFALLVYLVFAFVVVRQVYLMTEAIHGQLEVPLKTIAIFHFLAATLVFLLAILIL